MRFAQSSNGSPGSGSTTRFLAFDRAALDSDGLPGSGSAFPEPIAPPDFFLPFRAGLFLPDGGRFCDFDAAFAMETLLDQRAGTS
jgi:hypothetical protein